MLIGRKAPEFSAVGYYQEDIKEFKLKDFMGKWIILCFYPGDFTFGCPTELSSIALKYNELSKLDAQVMTISVDSPFSHKVWNEEELSKMIGNDMPFPMLSDPGGKIGALYNVYDDELGIDLRGRFIIDPEGIIQSTEILTPYVGRNPEELIRQLKAYRHHYITGEFTPSGWTEGEIAIKPSTKIAGRVWKLWDPKNKG